MKKKQIRFLLPLGFLLISLVVLAGCRPSTALTRLMSAMNALNPGTEETTTEEEQEEDKSSDQMDPIDEERDDAEIEEIEEMVGRMLENMDEETAQEALEAVYSASAGSSEWGAQTYNPDRLRLGRNSDSPLVLDVNSSAISSESEIVGRGSSDTSEASPRENNENGTDSSSDPAANYNQTGYDGDGQRGIETPPEDLSGVNDDPNSDPAPGPDDPEPEPEPESDQDPDPDPEPEPSYPSPDGPFGSVVAPGQLGIAVCMLGGPDCLAATSQDFEGNDWAQKVFNKDGQLDICSFGWAGDGSEPMSDEMFQYLVNEVKPELWLDIRGSNMYSDGVGGQREYLDSHDEFIRYEVDGFDSDGQIQATMLIIGTLLGDQSANGGKNAPQVASDYCTFCWDIESALSGLSSIDAVFIDGWDNEAKMYVNYSDGSTEELGEGAAYTTVGNASRPLNDYLNYAKISNFAANPYCCDPIFSQTSLSYWKSSYSYNPETTPDGALAYISPICNGPYDFYFTNGRSDVGMLTYQSSRNNTNSVSEYTFASLGGLGLDYFKTVIVADNDAANYIGTDKHWSWSFDANNMYDSRYSLGAFGAAQEVANDKGDTFLSNIIGYYDVYIQPSGGVGDWLNGSPESILEAIWAAAKIQGFRPANLKTSQQWMEDLISSFYQDFYDYDLKSGSDEMNEILSGN